MSKCVRQLVGFYLSLSSNALHPSFRSKYRPKAKPDVMGTYELERVVAKGVRGGRVEYFFNWKDYDAAENTWEPDEHLPEDLLTSFESRDVDRLHAKEGKERLALLFESSLKSPGPWNETLTIRHDVVRSLFPGMPSDLRGNPYFAEESELISAGLGSSLKQCLTVTGGGCKVSALASIRLFIWKSPAFLNEDGKRAARRPVEKV